MCNCSYRIFFIAALQFISLNLGFSTPPPGPLPAFDFKWISGHMNKRGTIRAPKGEIVLIKYCVYNPTKPKQILLRISPEENPGVEILEYPKFSKNTFETDEYQTCVLKIRVLINGLQNLKLHLLDGEDANKTPHVYDLTQITINNPNYVDSPLMPWDEKYLCDWFEYKSKLNPPGPSVNKLWMEAYRRIVEINKLQTRDKRKTTDQK